MARKVQPKVPARRSRGREPEPSMNLGRRSHMILGGGLVAIVLGYVFLAGGSITAAPILLVLGYGFLVPWALLAKGRGAAGAARRPPAGTGGPRPGEGSGE